MKETHKVIVGISPTPEILNPKCSCTECDSVSCFTKRRIAEQCGCELCMNSKSCLFPKTDTVNVKGNVTEQTPENIVRELVQHEIVYEFDSNNRMRIISKKRSRLLYETVESKDKIEEEENDKPATSFHSIAVTSSCKKSSPSTEKLSAQVMDVPYQDFQKSIYKPNIPSNLPNLSALDIFNRIKEAYKACSCKVCECIVGKSLPNDLCRCKPCDCNDCTNFTRNVKSFTDYEGQGLKDDDGCPCIRCNRSSCKGIGKGKNSKTQNCECVGMLQHDYLRSDSYSHACDCEPCQCIECKPKSIHRHRTVTVAPVGEDYQRRNVCQCSPCECFDCGHSYGLPSNVHNEMSTSTNRHPQCQCETCLNEACIPDGNEVCRCERQSKVMSKPFQQDYHDYDIRRAAITYDSKQKYKEVNNYDTIAMFASVKNSYSKREANNKQCDCDQCECLSCKYKDNGDKSSVVVEPFQNYKFRIKPDCKCSPCECEFCAQHNSEPTNIKKSNICGCDICNCVIRDGLPNSYVKSDQLNINKPESNFTKLGDCKYNPCECAECEKLMASTFKCIKQTDSDEVIYPVKKGEKLTPLIYKNKIKDAFIESCISTLDSKEDILKQRLAFRSSLRSVEKTKTRDQNELHDDCIKNEKYMNCFHESNSNHQIACNYHARTEKVKHAQISKCANATNLHSRKTEPGALGSNFSANSSKSVLKDDITPSKCRLKSWESSCNSSGHDYPSYLIHFPKATVDNCINNVMRYDSENNIKLAIALNSKSNVKKQESQEYNMDLNVNFPIPPKYLPLKTVFSQQNLIDNKKNQSQTKENNCFKYSVQNFEGKPYRAPIFETSDPKEINTISVMRDDCPFLSLNRKNKSSSLEEDYERVQNTLQEARVFTLHLVQLLEKYEKANREYESVSEKIKKSYDNFNISNTSNHPKSQVYLFNSFDKNEVPTREQTSSGSSTEELVSINKNPKNNNKIQFAISHDIFSDNILISEACNDNNEGRDESGDNINKIHELLNTITEQKEPVDVLQKRERKRRVVTKLCRRFNKLYKRSIICSKRIKSVTNSSSMRINATIAIKTNNTQIPEVKLIEQKRNIDQDTKENIPDFNEVKSAKATEDVNVLKRVKKSTTELRVSVTENYTKDHHLFQKDVVMIKQPMIEDNRNIIAIKNEKPWTILKKNFNMNTHDRRLSLLTELENDVKTAAQAISKQPANENATYVYENKALVKLHSEVRKLLDMPILKKFENTVSGHKAANDIMHNILSKTSSSQTINELEHGQKNANMSTLKVANMTAKSSRNGCEKLKVNFLTVRRVSDHTLLVKWNTPRMLSNVEGYELLVDGRAVQKIFSPSCSMAVVTCLPHSDKVLLTVRTVLRPPRPARCPVTTVIYQSRIK